jgi:hypothetical protein
VAEYKRKGRGSLGRLQAALNHRREHFEGWAAREIATEALPEIEVRNASAGLFEQEEGSRWSRTTVGGGRTKS